jgi:hypothetical protein
VGGTATRFAPVGDADAWAGALQAALEAPRPEPASGWSLADYGRELVATYREVARG